MIFACVIIMLLVAIVLDKLERVQKDLAKIKEKLGIKEEE